MELLKIYALDLGQEINLPKFEVSLDLTSVYWPWMILLKLWVFDMFWVQVLT